MRTENFCAPKTLTPATPLTIDNRCARTDSAYWSTSESGMVDELNVRNRIGWSAGFTFWYEGGEGMPGGSCRAARAIMDCTSWAAESMSRLKSNCSVMLVLP